MAKKQSFSANFGSISEIIIPRIGDLVSNMYIHITLPKLGKVSTNTTYSAENFNTKYGWVNSIGHTLIDYIELQIGGQKIDQHSGKWLDLITQLTKMDAANASLYDGAHSLYEAILMAARINKKYKVGFVNRVNSDYLKILESNLTNFELKKNIDIDSINKKLNISINYNVALKYLLVLIFYRGHNCL